MNLSIRSRLAILYIAVFFVILSLVLAVTSLVTTQEIDEEVHELLRDERRWLLTLLTEEYQGLLSGSPSETGSLGRAFRKELTERYGYRDQFVTVLIRTEKGERRFSGSGIPVIENELPSEFLQQVDGYYDWDWNGYLVTILIRRAEWGMLIIGAHNNTFIEVVEAFWETLLPVLPAIFLMVLTAGWIMARLVMRPVVSTARAAENLTLTNLDQRLPPYTGNDEFGILVSTLNGMIDRIDLGVKRLQKFTQDAAHELRTPLTILRGELELTCQEGSNHAEGTNGALQKSLDRVIAMSKMVENLMMLAQSDSGSYPIRKSIFRLDCVVKDIYEDFRILAESRSLKMILEHCDPVDFHGDKALIYQLLLNLCDNALKYTPGGRIVLSLRVLRSRIELIIGDSGIGIPAAQIPHIFDRFYRVDQSRSSFGQGSGLGLAIVHWIVRAHQGKIDIASQPKQGTTVRISLPAGLSAS